MTTTPRPPPLAIVRGLTDKTAERLEAAGRKARRRNCRRNCRRRSHRLPLGAPGLPRTWQRGPGANGAFPAADTGCAAAGPAQPGIRPVADTRNPAPNSGITRALFLPTPPASSSSQTTKAAAASSAATVLLPCRCCLAPLSITQPAHGISRHMHRLALHSRLGASLRCRGRFYACGFFSFSFPATQPTSALLYGHPIPAPIDKCSQRERVRGL